MVVPLWRGCEGARGDRGGRRAFYRRGWRSTRWGLRVKHSLGADDPKHKNRDGNPLIDRQLLLQQDHREKRCEEDLALIRDHPQRGLQVGVAHKDHDIADGVEKGGHLPRRAVLSASWRVAIWRTRTES